MDGWLDRKSSSYKESILKKKRAISASRKRRSHLETVQRIREGRSAYVQWRSEHRPYDRTKRASQYHVIEGDTGKTRWHRIQAPQHLNLKADRSEFLRFVKEFKRMVLKERLRVFLDMQHVKAISPIAMCCLLAEIYRCREFDKSTVRLNGSYPDDTRVRARLVACGFFRLLKIRDPHITTRTTYPREYIPFESHNITRGDCAENLKIALLGGDRKLTDRASKSLYKALTEGMTNVLNHAYPKSAPASKKGFIRLRNRWWMVGHFDEQKNELHVLLLDQGIGIPKSLTEKYTIGWLVSVLQKSAPTLFPSSQNLQVGDAGLIRAAMEVGRTSTNQPHRGKGLPQMRDFIENLHDGKLRILSRFGEYVYFGNGQKEAFTNHSDSLDGTLVHWTFPLSAVEAQVEAQGHGE